MADNAVLDAPGAVEAPPPAQGEVPDQLAVGLADQTTGVEGDGTPAAEEAPPSPLTGLTKEQLKELRKSNPELAAVVDEEAEARKNHALEQQRASFESQRVQQQQQAQIEARLRMADAQSEAAVNQRIKAVITEVMNTGDAPDDKVLAELSRAAAGVANARWLVHMDETITSTLPPGTQVRTETMAKVTAARATGNPALVTQELTKAVMEAGRNQGWQEGWNARDQAAKQQQAGDQTAEAARAARQAALAANQATAISGAPVGKPDYDRVLSDPTKPSADKDKAFEAKWGFKL